MDETWVYHFDPETKTQSVVRKHVLSLTPGTFCAAQSAGKVMPSSKGTTPFDYTGEGAKVVSIIQN